MRAVILRHPTNPRAPLLPIAGRPLLARQLEWLRNHGVEQVALEVADGPTDREIRRWLDQHRALADGVCVVPASAFPSPRRAAALAQFRRDQPLVALPGGMIGDADLVALMASHAELNALVTLPGRGGLTPGSLQFLGPVDRMHHRSAASGWGAFVDSHDDALVLSALALRGRLSGLVVPGAELTAGVWAGRGAVCEPGAAVQPGVFIGAGAYVSDLAEVGPSAIISEGAVVESGAVVRFAIVDPGVVVGEGVIIERAHATADGLFDLAKGTPLAQQFVAGELRLRRRWRRSAA